MEKLEKINNDIELQRKKLDELYNKRNELILGKIKKKLINQFIEYRIFRDEEGEYMKVYDIFGTDDVVIRGCGFYAEWTPYWDACQFSYDRAMDHNINIRDLEMNLENGLIKIISKEEFESRFLKNYKKLKETFYNEIDKGYEA